MLGFQTPSGSRITLSSFVQPKFGTSYSIGIKDGWISYLYSSRPLTSSSLPLPPAAAAAPTSSDRILLRDLLQCYRPLSSRAARHAVGHALVFGRLYLPQNRLEALLAARVAPEVHLTLRAVSQDHLRHGATLLGLAAWDDPRGRFGVETLASSDGGVLGLRGLWNATNPPSSSASSASGPEQTALSSSSSSAPSPSSSTSLSVEDSNYSSLPSPPPPPTSSHINNNGNGNNTPQQQQDPSYYGDKERINGRFSAGGEIYYGLLNKSGGVSVGGRFQTLPTHHGTPLTATLTFNLLGHVSATYAVTSGDCTLASCFGFNMYSYESDWAVGMELWNRRGPGATAAAAAAVATATDPVVGGGEGAQDGGQGKMAGLGQGGGEGEVQRAADDGDDGARTPITVMRTADDAETSTKLIRTVGTAGEAVMVVPSTPVTGAGAGAAPSSSEKSTKTRTRERSFQAKMEWRLDNDDDDAEDDEHHDDQKDPEPAPAVETTVADKKSDDDCPTGVLKCRCDQHMRIGLLYEGRYKSLLFSLGTDVDLKRLDAPFRTVGLAVQFSS